MKIKVLGLLTQRKLFQVFLRQRDGWQQKQQREQILFHGGDGVRSLGVMSLRQVSASVDMWVFAGHLFSL
jgi:hypothetical protein